MNSPNQLSSGEMPEDQLLELLPLLAENFTPQLGYRVELTDVILSDIDIAVDYQKAFASLLGAPITNEASLVYTYNVQEDSLDIETIKFNLQNRLQDERNILADSIYLQRYADGFVQSFGMGQETIAEVPITPRSLPELPIQRVLEPAGLYSFGRGDNVFTIMADKLSDSEHWVVREQQTVPLPPDNTDTQKQMIIVRSRSITANSGMTNDSGEKRSLYSDDYEIVFETISPPLADPNKKHIEELSLLVRHNDANGRTFSLIDTDYDRYEHPMVLGLTEINNLQAESREPSDSDFAAYVKLLEDFAA